VKEFDINVKNQITRALITGASGFIGNALVESLHKQSIEIIAIDQLPCRRDHNKSKIFDIKEENILDQFLSKDTVIFHMAANANVASSVNDPANDFQNTLYGLFQVLESARRFNCRVIFPSTASIFDTTNELPVSEKSYVKPSSPYGAAKVAGESYCFVYHRCYGLDVRIARMFSVYGLGMSRFAIHDIIRKIQHNDRSLEILGDGKQIRDYLYIDDAVHGLEIIASNGEPGEDYNLASGEQIKLLDLAQMIAKEMDCSEIKIEPSGKSFPGDVPKWYGDISKIKKIGFQQRTSLKDGLAKTIYWLQNNK
jgi:UDP-glucose 4-epimerase